MTDYIAQWVHKEEKGWVRIGRDTRIKFLKAKKNREVYLCVTVYPHIPPKTRYILTSAGWFTKDPGQPRRKIQPESGLCCALNAARELTLNGDPRPVL